MPIRDRTFARELARRHLASGNPTGWFEELYAAAEGDPNRIPWADLKPNPNLVRWLDQNRITGRGKKALKIGCGLGDDAEELVHRGFDVTAFDISETAVQWCRYRFPNSKVDYKIQDLFKAPKSWDKGFDFVLESYTLQVLPPNLRPNAIKKIAGFVAPLGFLLVIARAREESDDPGQMPWPLVQEEFKAFEKCGLTRVSFEDYMDRYEDPPVRRYRVVYQLKNT
jgi:SAM-dependent methyltransferase